MRPVVGIRALSSRQPGCLRAVQRRNAASYEPPTQPPKQPNEHRSFWISFSRPMAKVFLGALFTYQITYLAWSKLESMEEEKNGASELGKLEDKLKELTAGKTEGKQ